MRLRELLSDARFRLRALVHRATVEQELDDEMQFHLEQECAKLIARGLTPEDAMRQARLAFGGVEQIKEASRDMRGLSWLEVLRQDLRYAIRSLRRQPGFTAAVIVTLGLGIGANAAMFGVVDQLLFRDPARMRNSHLIHRVYFGSFERTSESLYTYAGYTRFLDLQHSTQSFDRLVAFVNRTLAVGSGGDVQELKVGVVSAGYFDLFDAAPILGRLFTTDEDRIPAGAPVAVLTYSYWQQQYGGSPAVLGQTVEVGTTRHTIIGVLPPGFIGVRDGAPPAMFIPITALAPTIITGSGWYTSYYWNWLEILARRKPDVPIATAEADLNQAFRRSWESERALASSPMRSAEVARARSFLGPVLRERGPHRSRVTRVASWVTGVTTIVLLIACANVANLMLARAVRRRREIAVRLALGVSRSRLIVQLLTETLLLAGGGALAGLALAQWGGALLHTLFLADEAAEQTVLDPRTLSFAIVITLVAGLATSLVPILQARRTDLATTLKASARQGGHHRSPVRSALLLLQGTLSVVLLVGAGLFVRSLQNVQGLRLGYDVKQVLNISVNMRGTVITAAERDQLNLRLLETARATAGVELASLAVTAPFWSNSSTRLFVAGIDSVNRFGTFTLQAASPGYLSTVGTRLLRGRDYTDADRPGNPEVMVASAAMAAALWPGKDAVGQCVRLGADTAPCVTVIGVAENIKQGSLTDDPGYHYYLPVDQYAASSLRRRFDDSEGGGLDAYLFVRVRGEASAMVETVRRQLQTVLPGGAYLTINPMRNIIDPNVRSWQLGATLFLVFGALALVLAAIGLYSVIAYDVAQRSQELGVRMALGAQAGDVLRLVMADGIRFALLGVALGSAVALAAGPWLKPLLYHQSPSDPVIFSGIAATLLVVAILASGVPALRATRVSPSTALRAD